LPKGWYTGRIIDAEIKRNDRGSVGTNVKLEVAEGEHAGRHLYAYHLMHLPEPRTAGQQTACEIGHEILNSLFVAAGFATAAPDEPTELIGSYVEFKVKHEKNEEYGDDDGNQERVTMYREPANVATPSLNSPNAGDDIPF